MQNKVLPFLDDNKSDLRSRDGNLINNWYIACLSNELDAAKPLKRVIYDYPLVLLRDQQGVPGAILDRCLHRHAKLSPGCVKEGSVVCPYHGWSFNRLGEVTNVPSEGPGPCKMKAKIRSFPTFEQDGAIWVWTGSGEPSEAKPPHRFPFKNDSHWQNYFSCHDFKGEITALMENFMDVPHTIFVHDKWFRSQARIEVPMDVVTQKGRVLATYKQQSDSIGFSGKILNPSQAPMHHTDLFIFPNIIKAEYHFGDRSFIINSQTTPISALESKTYTYFTYQLGWMTKLIKPFLKFYTNKVVLQDVEVIENLHENLQLDPEERFHNTSADILHLQIQKLRNDGRVGKDPKLRSQKHSTSFWI